MGFHAGDAHRRPRSASESAGPGWMKDKHFLHCAHVNRPAQCTYRLGSGKGPVSEKGGHSIPLTDLAKDLSLLPPSPNCGMSCRILFIADSQCIQFKSAHNSHLVGITLYDEGTTHFLWTDKNREGAPRREKAKGSYLRRRAASF